MTFLEYSFLHMAISLGIVSAALFVNRGVPWFPGALITAMITASIIALVSVGAVGIFDWAGYL